MKILEYILNAIVEMAGGIFGFFFETIQTASTPKKDTDYSAEFGEISSQLQRKPSGMRVGSRWGNTITESHEHLICLGGSGSKKSSCVGYTTILQCNEPSYVVFDYNGEYVLRTSGYKAQQGYKVLKLDYDDYTHSIAFNYLDKAASETEILAGSQTIIKNTAYETQGDYWIQSAENIVGFSSVTLKKYAPAYANLPNVLNMIQVFSFDPGRIDKWMLKQCTDERILNRYKSIVATPQKTLQSSISMATNALAVYGSPNIAAITSTDTLPFENFRRERTILYICGSPSSSEFARGVSASYFEAFFSYILQKPPEAGMLPITFIIDEANSVFLQTLPKILEMGRKFKISVASLWQDYNQIEHRFGKNQAANILANSKMKVFMPSGQPLETCRMLSELLGKYSYRDEKDILRTRELLTAQEIFQLKDILLLNGNNKPLLLKPRPYFENAKLLRYSQLPPYSFENTVPLSEPKLLQF